MRIRMINQRNQLHSSLTVEMEVSLSLSHSFSYSKLKINKTNNSRTVNLKECFSRVHINVKLLIRRLWYAIVNVICLKSKHIWNIPYLLQLYIIIQNLKLFPVYQTCMPLPPLLQFHYLDNHNYVRSCINACLPFATFIYKSMYIHRVSFLIQQEFSNRKTCKRCSTTLGYTTLSVYVPCTFIVLYDMTNHRQSSSLLQLFTIQYQQIFIPKCFVPIRKPKLYFRFFVFHPERRGKKNRKESLIVA